MTAAHAALAGYLALLALQRVDELARSARHARALRARGAVESGAGQFGWFVGLHTAYPLLLAAEVLGLGALPGPAWPWWLAGAAAAVALRAWAVATLGPRWNVRVWVVPGTEPIRAGPYRFMRHPNYLAVALELLCVPMAFGAWRTAIAISLANAALLWARIRVEERALERARTMPAPFATPADE